jgi:ribonucleotide reductase alpha subunit
MDLWEREVRLFKQGSGTGSNFSNLRGLGEKLSGGGRSSGLISFLEIGDRAAGSIKSGGVTRRAAKMVVVDADHPDIEEYINWKPKEEQKAAAMWIGSQFAANPELRKLIPQEMLDRVGCHMPEEVFSIDYEGEAIRSVGGQNANNSVRLTDEFMRKLSEPQGALWYLKERTTGKLVGSMQATYLWNKICRAAWASADPGLQFHDTINRWHTCKADGEIRASNPCCFIGSTLVDTSEGLIPIEKLARISDEPLPYAFSFDRTNALPALRKIKKAWRAGYTRNLVKVRLDTGEEFTCTPEHRWLLRNGEYVEAKNLTKGMSLRKIGRTINDERGSRCSILHRCTDEVPNGTQYQSRWMWEQVHGPFSKGFEVHHIDDDPTNDKLSNLELVESVDHRINHMSGSNNPRYMIVDDKAMIEIYDAILAAPRKTHKLKSGVTPGRWNAYVRENNLVGIVPQAQSPSTGGKIQGMYWHEFVAKMEKIRSKVNARVLEVMHIQTDEDVAVFDIEVEGTHNFGIRGGSEKNQSSVVVSNSEYMFLDNTACNLASLNLGKFYKPTNSADPASTEFDINLFCHVARLMTVVLDISVSMASFPSREIAVGSYNYRTLGLGYANLGGLLIRMGLPYDSNEGRAEAEAITALMTGVAYTTSQELAKELGPFPRWEVNKDSMADVIKMHYSKAGILHDKGQAGVIAFKLWDKLKDDCYVGFRNAQVTLLAPTGTIGLLMDCDTLGVEPDFSLVKHKSLAGGGDMILVNEAVDEALTKLGYKEHFRNLIKAYIKQHGTVENCGDLDTSHWPVFDCAVPPEGFTRSIAPMGHVKMVAAVQPFLSGAVSKTINIPNSATVEDVSEVYIQSWKLGLKAVALYRDGSKLAQPLNTAANEMPKMEIALGEEKPQARWITEHNPSNRDGSFAQRFTVAKEEKDTAQYTGKVDEIKITSPYLQPFELSRGEREYLPWRREDAYVQKIKIGPQGQSVFLTIGKYPDGRPGEIYVELGHAGSSLRSSWNLTAMMISIGLQYGVPVGEYVRRLEGIKFEPSGFVEGHGEIKFASSIADYIARDLALTFLGDPSYGQVQSPTALETQSGKGNGQRKIHLETCPSCGEPALTRSGTCQTCLECGYNDGCGG